MRNKEIYNHHIELVRQVHDRTADKTLRWEETAFKDVFEASLGAVAVQIGEYRDDPLQGQYYRLDLLNGDGQIADQFFPYTLNQNGHAGVGDLFRQIFIGAGKIARGSEVALAAALEKLAELKRRA